MITITQKITPENHYLLFMAAEAQRKSDDEVIFVDRDIVFNYYKGPIYLPNNLIVNGFFDLIDCIGLAKLPDNLKVNCSLDLSGCTGLTQLPEKLSIARSFYLFNCPGITKLPDNLNVVCNIYISEVVEGCMQKMNAKFAKQITFPRTRTID